MVDRDQTNMKLRKKIHLGGQGVPRELFWGDFMARRLKSLKIWIFRAFKLSSLVRMVDRDQTNIKLKKIHLGGKGVPRGTPGGPQGTIVGRFHGPATKIIENLDF